MAIQVRRGMLKDFDPTKLLPGEWAVATDTETKNQIVWMCFAAGIVKRMGTYEDFHQQIEEATEEIKAGYLEAFSALLKQMEQAALQVSRDKDAVIQIRDDMVGEYIPQMISYLEDAAEKEEACRGSAGVASTKAAEAARSAKDAESFTRGGTGVRQGEDTDNAKYYKDLAKYYFENLEQSGAVTGVKGGAEETYRTGNVNLSPSNIGALSNKGDIMHGVLRFQKYANMQFENAQLEGAGGHARGIEYLNKDGTRWGGIGAFGNSGTLSYIYAGADTENPWASANGLIINRESMKWKNNEVLTKAGGVINGAISPAGGIAYAGRESYIAYPEDGYFLSRSAVTGLIKIILPVSWSNTMVRFTVSIFNYASQESVDYHIAGYNHNGGTGHPAWINCSAVCVGKAGGAHSNLTVRFGHTGSKCAITIGEAATAWSYPQIKVHDILLGFENYNFASWHSGWKAEVTPNAMATSNFSIRNTHVAYGGVAGSCTGNAATADKATNDSRGRIIKDTYAEKGFTFLGEPGVRGGAIRNGTLSGTREFLIIDFDPITNEFNTHEVPTMAFSAVYQKGVNKDPEMEISLGAGDSVFIKYFPDASSFQFTNSTYNRRVLVYYAN